MDSLMLNVKGTQKFGDNANRPNPSLVDSKPRHNLCTVRNKAVL